MKHILSGYKHNIHHDRKIFTQKHADADDGFVVDKNRGSGKLYLF